jgi:hypothetical protein
MFVQPSALQSSAIAGIKLNPAFNQVIVNYVGNAKSYLYDNVSIEGITNFIFGEIESAGKFVNAYCKGNRVTVC